MPEGRFSRIRELFEAARALPKQKRAEFLQNAAPDDLSVRNEVRSLLDAAPDAESFLESAILSCRLAPGTKIGHFEVVEMLGSGGMGEVYRARDSRLKRDIGIKVLPSSFARDPDRIARFEREARAAGALNHPNIVAVYDIGQDDETYWIATELVVGEPLTKVIERGPLAPRKAIEVAKQVAAGLTLAHAAGIVHRDLKPGNIMLTREGRVKILDFGLAKEQRTVSPETATRNLTGEGTVMGTAGYMSPEQVRGEAVDQRSDLFSFGVIVYEMLRGKRAFSGGSSIDVMNAILKEDPPELPSSVPAALDHIVRRCLEKDRERRFQTAADLAFALDTSLASPPRKKTSPIRFSKWMAIPACFLLAGSIAVLLLSRDVGQDMSRYRYTPFAMNLEGQAAPKWSPDGKAIAYLGMVNGHPQVFVRYLDSAVSTQLTTNREYAQPTRWSPDSKRILFFAPGPDSTEAKRTRALYSIAVVGGEAEHLTPMPGHQVFEDVSPDNQTIAIYGNPEGGKSSVFISSGIGSSYRPYEPAPFTSKVFFNVTTLRFSPNGKKLLLIRTGDSGKEEAWLLPYPPGKSAPQRVLTQFPTQRLTNDFCWMPDNRHVVLALSETGTLHLWIADTESEVSYQVTSGISSQGTVAVSPDGKQIIYSEEYHDLNITSVSLLDGKSKNVIATDVKERMPAWSANSDNLAYITDRNGTAEIWVRSGDDSDHPLITQKEFPGTHFLMNPSLSPDGKRLIFSGTWIMSLSGGAPERLNESANGFGGAWSPDGRRFAVLDVRDTLFLVKVGSREKPVMLRDDVYSALPDWSPTGAWLTFQDKSGWNLISPDGKTVKPLGKIASSYLAFSKDGKLLYGIRQQHDKTTLFSLDIATLKTTDIHELGKDLAPASDLGPGIRFSLTPDGKSITYATAVDKSNLWILEGFRQPGLLSRLGLNWSR